MERPLSSSDETEPVLCVRRLFIGCCCTSSAEEEALALAATESGCDEPASEITREGGCGNFDDELAL